MNPPTISSRPLARDTEPISTRRTLGCQRYKQIKEKGKRVPRWPGFSYSEACLACPGKRRTCYTKPGLVEHATKRDGERMERRKGVNKWTDDEWWRTVTNIKNAITSSSRRIPDCPHVSKSSSACDQKFSSWSGSVPSCPTVNLLGHNGIFSRGGTSRKASANEQAGTTVMSAGDGQWSVQAMVGGGALGETYRHQWWTRHGGRWCPGGLWGFELWGEWGRIGLGRQCRWQAHSTEPSPAVWD